MNFNETVFYTDLDGTLLQKHKGVSESDLKHIRNYIENGGLFGIATGRTLHTTLDYIEMLKPNMPSVLYNGAVVYNNDTKQIIFAKYLPDMAREMLNDVYNKFPNTAPEVFTLSGQYCLHLNETELWHQNAVNSEFELIESSDLITEPWCKMMFTDTEENIDLISKYMQKYMGCGVRFVRSNPNFFEVLPENVSKAEGFKIALEHLNLKRKKVASAGDYENDIEMLLASDISFCPANSLDKVKKAANYILNASCEESAISEAFEILTKI